MAPKPKELEDDTYADNDENEPFMAGGRNKRSSFSNDKERNSHKQMTRIHIDLNPKTILVGQILI